VNPPILQVYASTKDKYVPIIRDIPLSLKIKEVLRRAGIKEHSKLKPKAETSICELLVSVDEAHLLEPAIAYEIYPITKLGRNKVSLDGGAALRCSLIYSVFPQAKELAVLVCTISPRLEEKVADYFGRSESLQGMLLDAIGSVAVDSLALEMCRLIAGEASSRDLQAGSPLSPGSPGFPITEQWQMLNLVPAEEIGVSLASTAIMIPRKSVSMVIGIGTQMATWTRAEVCSRCTLSKTCPYRIEAY